MQLGMVHVTRKIALLILRWKLDILRLLARNIM